MRLAIASTIALALLGSPTGSAEGAPIVRSAIIGLTFDLESLTPGFSFSSATTVTVDEAAGTVALPAGSILSVTAPLQVTATNPGGILNPLTWSATKVGLAGGTLRFGGATTQAVPAEGPCPEAGVVACVSGGGLGGVVPLTGVVNLLHTVVALTFDLALLNFGATGEVSFPTIPYTAADGGPFTTRTAVAGSNSLTVTRQGGVTPVLSQISLVAPTHVIALGGSSRFFTTLTITFTDGEGLPAFVPEPVGMALVLSGVLGLVLLRSANGSARRTR